VLFGFGRIRLWGLSVYSFIGLGFAGFALFSVCFD